MRQQVPHGRAWACDHFCPYCSDRICRFWWFRFELFFTVGFSVLLQAQLAVAEQRGAAAAAEAEAAQKLSDERELLLVAVAPSNGDIGDDAVRGVLVYQL